jgi:transcriptional regulator with XRE-family HTH domain
VNEYSLHLGEVVRRERKRRGWTQQRLADELSMYQVNLAQSGVARLELGQRPTDVSEMLVLRDIFELAFYELLPDEALGPRGGSRAGG